MTSFFGKNLNEAKIIDEKGSYFGTVHLIKGVNGNYFLMPLFRNAMTIRCVMKLHSSLLLFAFAAARCKAFKDFQNNSSALNMGFIFLANEQVLWFEPSE